MIGKVYMLRSHETDKFYIGSTQLNLSQRMAIHKHHYKLYLAKKYEYITAFEILKYADCWIELVDACDIESTRELRELEDSYISNLFDDTNCVNKNNAVFDYKRYYSQNKDKILSQERKKYDPVKRRERYLRAKNKAKN